MIGLIKKDLLIIKNNAKALLVIVLMNIIFSFTCDSDITFIIPFLAVVLHISTFSYDDFNNWNAYAITLPQGRQKIVQAKYLSVILTSLLVAILSILISLTVSISKNSLDLNDLFSSTATSLVAISIIISILIPFILKYGSEKGRIIIFAFVFGFIGLIALISKLTTIKIPSSILTLLNNYGEVILIIFSILILIVSYLISQKIYSKKEF